MSEDLTQASDASSEGRASARPRRADAKRNMAALLRAALDVFNDSGVDAPYRSIADAAGVGIGTIYRHFPQRSDLIIAVYRQELEACAESAADLAARYPPGEALDRWMLRLVEFIRAKRGLAAALHSGDPAYSGLPSLLERTLRPALRHLLDAAAKAGDIRAGADAWDLLRAAASLSAPAPATGSDYAPKMVGLLIDGLRYGAINDS